MLPSEDRTGRRLMFDQVAELYDRARPGYPAQAFDDLVDLAGLAAGSRVLEIGCGTGQATVSLAERGLCVVCVELGEGLAAVAGRNLAAFPGVEVVNADFETWEPEAGGFDAVVAFTSFHWLDPELRFDKSARLLGPQGSLAVVTTQHVLPPGADSFFVDVQDDYDAVAPDPENRPPPPPEDVPDLSDEFDRSGCFGEVTVRRYMWDVEYSAVSYMDVLDTYSGHRAMDPPARERLYERIRRRIEARPGGRIRKSHLALLHVARRR